MVDEKILAEVNAVFDKFRNTAFDNETRAMLVLAYQVGALRAQLKEAAKQSPHDLCL